MYRLQYCPCPTPDGVADADMPWQDVRRRSWVDYTNMRSVLLLQQELEAAEGDGRGQYRVINELCRRVA